ncbi:MAG: putative transcriptional regulatory protein for hcr operon [Subtercola sp.]|nr:putative transcriptional regulatory protein for hcr operon [Subtercola sp.]
MITARCYDHRVPHPSSTSRVPFLLSQLGSIAADSFASKTAGIGLSPNEAGVLRLLAREPGMSQRALSHRLGTQPSRMVALIDTLESAGLLTRARSAADRRNYELHLTDAGIATMNSLRQVSEANEAALLGGLEPAEREALAVLLTKLAASLELDADVHPGSSGGVR